MRSILTTRLSRTNLRHWWRVLWAVVLLVHIPATLNVLSAGVQAGWGRAGSGTMVLLVLGNVFFLLEILFACSLRVLSSVRSAVVFVLVLAMLHAGMIERSAPQLVADGQMTACLIVTTLGAAGLRSFLRLLAAVHTALADMTRRASGLQVRLYARRRVGWAWHSFTASLRAWTCAPLRAPPALSL